jgi:hypothetical protein
MTHSVALLNTSILTADGEYKMYTISLAQAKELVQNNNLISAIGHQSTADIMSALLGMKIPANRIQFEQQQGQQALVFKLNGRPDEGKILSVEEIEEIGYSFKLLVRKKIQICPIYCNCENPIIEGMAGQEFCINCNSPALKMALALDLRRLDP